MPRQPGSALASVATDALDFNAHLPVVVRVAVQDAGGGGGEEQHVDAAGQRAGAHPAPRAQRQRKRLGRLRGWWWWCVWGGGGVGWVGWGVCVWGGGGEGWSVSEGTGGHVSSMQSIGPPMARNLGTPARRPVATEPSVTNRLLHLQSLSRSPPGSIPLAPSLSASPPTRERQYRASSMRLLFFSTRTARPAAAAPAARAALVVRPAALRLRHTPRQPRAEQRARKREERSTPSPILLQGAGRRVSWEGQTRGEGARGESRASSGAAVAAMAAAHPDTPHASRPSPSLPASPPQLRRAVGLQQALAVHQDGGDDVHWGREGRAEGGVSAGHTALYTRKALKCP